MMPSIMTLPKMTIGMLIERPSTSSVYFMAARSGVGAAALAAAATAITLSTLITRSASRIVRIAWSSRVLAETSGPSSAGTSSRMPIPSSSTPPTTFSQGSSKRLAADTVRTMRSAIAAALPQNTASRCWRGGSERAASAIMTALSPLTSRLIQTMAPSSIQKMGRCSMSIGECSLRAGAAWRGTRGPASRAGGSPCAGTRGPVARPGRVTRAHRRQRRAPA